ncbi:MAG: hypothetical protein KJO54_10160 [Gammaproteobacteria bacterium]|nr:hypothetical protein [Gammaproteobacteria bacterium]NNF62322.1 hypothetical protein [Gammaproteobacteria bacterium]NNM20886.1 hypothetical protein [Gammaproteobacteria bacterium]
MRKLIYTAALLTLSTAAGAYDSHAIDEVDIDVVSDRGRHFETYPLRSSSDDTFRAYLEAVPQENYSIRVRNRGGERIGLVIAVDGRNIISGKKSHLRSNERMYILGPYESATYSGWRTSGNRVNRFYFTDVEDSYSAAFGDYSAMGVISVAAFREKQRYRPHSYNKRDDDRYESDSSYKSGKSAPRASEKGGRAFDEPGTGYGNDQWSPSVRVEFEAEKRAFSRYFMKYEWRETLCEKGVADCYRRNRLWNDRWDDRGFAPPPPRYKKKFKRSRWFSRWHW